jgi:bacterioferritin
MTTQSAGPGIDRSPEIIDALNEILTGELTAINQYFLHAKMLQNWGFQSLYKKIWAESIDEMKHADQLIERVLYLDGLPNVQRMAKVNIGENIEEILRCDLGLEDVAIPRLNRAIALCTEKGDNGTRALLEAILVSEEAHRDWLQAQMDQIRMVGVQNYLAQHIHSA